MAPRTQREVETVVRMKTAETGVQIHRGRILLPLTPHIVAEMGTDLQGYISMEVDHRLCVITSNIFRWNNGAHLDGGCQQPMPYGGKNGVTTQTSL